MEANSLTKYLLWQCAGKPNIASLLNVIDMKHHEHFGPDANEQSK